MAIDREAVLRTAERLLRQGKLDAAIAEYVRLAEDQPRDWNSINALGDLYVRAGNTDRAVAQFVRIADHLFDEGFLPKAAALYKKALKVKQDHEHTLFRLSEIAVQQGLLADAKLYLRQLVKQRQSRGDERGVAECVLRIGAIDEDDGEAKIAAARAAQAIGDVDRAIDLLQEAAAAFERQGRGSEAADALVAAADLRPDDEALRTTVARALIAAGHADRAQPFLSSSAIADDPDLLLAVAKRDLMAGQSVEAQAALMRFVAMAPDRRALVSQLADELLTAGRVDDAYGCVDVLVDAALFEASFDRATELLASFLAGHKVIPGLLKLVDVYVDAGRDDKITTVQEQLADAYLDNGQPAEARVVAEDLIARQPQVEAHVNRLRRALTALGVDDVEDVIARQLDVAPIFHEVIEFTAMDSSPSAPVSESSAAAIPDPAPPTAPPPMQSEPASPPSVTQQNTSPSPAPPTRSEAPRRESYEIDLSSVLLGLKTSASGVAASSPTPAADSAAAQDPATLMERAQEYLRQGSIAEASTALKAVARIPQLRFKATAQLGRLSMERGDITAGIEWLEQAASAPSASQEETFAVLYDLADALEQAGEPVRALAVFMELEADAGAYRNVKTRIDQLTSGATGVNRGRT